MNVASLELCKELFKLSGWGEELGETEVYIIGKNDKLLGMLNRDEFSMDKWKESIPAYDLGYLLRKLPRELKDDADTFYRGLGVIPQSDIEVASYANGSVDRVYMKSSLICRANTPEDAVCKLAIELFKQGILAKETGELKDES